MVLDLGLRVGGSRDFHKLEVLWGHLNWIEIVLLFILGSPDACGSGGVRGSRGLAGTYIPGN